MVKKNPINKYKFVLVTWLDAESDITWSEAETANKWVKDDYVVYEAGWLVTENKKNIVIANQIGSNGSLGNRTKIPKTWVVKIQKVNVGRKK